MDRLLTALRAVGEPTRLRLLAVLARSELTVSELTQILGQSQPRVSRHLKLLADAGVLDRFQEGTWVFYRLADKGECGEIARTLLGLLPDDVPQLLGDRKRLDDIKRAHAEAANTYFRENAARWHGIRSLYVDDAEVERAILAAVGDRPIRDLLDLGTGTGRMLELFAGRIRHGLGVDLSREMLAVARANLERADLRHCQVRQGDIYQPPVPPGSADVATIHHVLHFLDDPAAAVREAARALRRGGLLIIVDFAPHQFEFLRTELSHRRLGFADDEVIAWGRNAGLVNGRVSHMEPDGEGDKLTVSLWRFEQDRDVSVQSAREVA